MPSLLGQQSGEQPPALFVERNEDSIDRLMLLGDISPGKLQTVKATTLSTRFLLVRHDRSPHVKENPGERIIPKMTKLFLYGSLVQVSHILRTVRERPGRHFFAGRVVVMQRLCRETLAGASIIRLD
jgi:hypothetical protein